MNELRVFLGRDDNGFPGVLDVRFEPSNTPARPCGNFHADEQTLAIAALLIAARIRYLNQSKWKLEEMDFPGDHPDKSAKIPAPIILTIEYRKTLFSGIADTTKKSTQAFFAGFGDDCGRVLVSTGGRDKESRSVVSGGETLYPIPLQFGLNPGVLQLKDIRVLEVEGTTSTPCGSEDALLNLFLELQVEYGKVILTLDEKNGQTKRGSPRFPLLKGEWVVPDAAGTEFLRRVRDFHTWFCSLATGSGVKLQPDSIVITIYGRPYPEAETGIGTFEDDLFYYRNISCPEVMFGPRVRKDKRSSISTSQEPAEPDQLTFRPAERTDGGFVAREGTVSYAEIRLIPRKDRKDSKGFIWINTRCNLDPHLFRADKWEREYKDRIAEIAKVVAEICEARLANHNERCGRLVNVIESLETPNEKAFSERLFDSARALKELKRHKDLKITAYLSLWSGREFDRFVVGEKPEDRPPDRLSKDRLPEFVSLVEEDFNHKPILGTAHGAEPQTTVVVPILADDGTKFLGALEIQSTKGQSFDSDDVQLFCLFCRVTLSGVFRKKQEQQGGTLLGDKSRQSGKRRSQTYLVTGFAGALGIPLVKRLIKEGIDVIGVDNLSTETKTLDEKKKEVETLKSEAVEKGVGFAFYQADIRNSGLSEILNNHRPQVVIHAAALVQDRESVSKFREFISVNVEGTANLLDAINSCGSVRHLVLTGSRSATGTVPTANSVMRENDPPRPVNPYGATKVAQEALCHAACVNHKLPVTVLRLNPLICSRIDMMPRKLLTALNRGKPIAKFGNGNGTRDWLHIDDAVDAIVTVAKMRPKGFQTFLIGSGKATTLNGLIQVAENVVGKGKADITKIPIPTGDALHGGISGNEKIRKAIGWKPKPKLTLEKGLRDLNNYLESNSFWTQSQSK